MSHTLEEHQRFIDEEVLIFNDDHVNLILCWIHNVFEVMKPNPYAVCFECKHVYQTAEDLEKSYTEITTALNKTREEGWPALPTSKPADQIHFCQECLHDF